MGMIKLRSVGPARELSVFIQIFRGDELDGCLLRLLCAALSEEYGTMLTASQPLPQRELSINDPAFPLFPEFPRSSHYP